MALIIVSMVCQQLIRESLFLRVLKTRSFALDETWYVNGRKALLTRRYVWGDISKAMLAHADLRYLIIGARLASVLGYIGLVGCILQLVLLTFS